MTAIRQFAGNNWSEDGCSQRIPLNLISLYVSVMTRNLLGSTPRVLLSTFNQQAKPMVNAMNGWANDEIERCRFADIERRCINDSLFLMGIMKVCLASPED